MHILLTGLTHIYYTTGICGKTSRHFMFEDYFVYSHNLCISGNDDKVRRKYALVSVRLKGLMVKTFHF